MRSLLSRILMALELDRKTLLGVASFTGIIAGIGTPIFFFGAGKITQEQQMALSLLAPAILLVTKVFMNPVAWGNPSTLKREKEFGA